MYVLFLPACPSLYFRDALVHSVLEAAGVRLYCFVLDNISGLYQLRLSILLKPLNALHNLISQQVMGPGVSAIASVVFLFLSCYLFTRL